MTLNFKCTCCEYRFEVSFMPNPLPDRKDAVRPARSADRDATLPCPSCDEEAVFDDKAFWGSQLPPAYVPSPLAWMESRGYRTTDMANACLRPGSTRKSGVHRFIQGLPGREGGLSKGEF